MIRDDAWGRWMEQQKSWGSLHFENIATSIKTKRSKESSIWGEDYTYIIYLYSHKKMFICKYVVHPNVSLNAEQNDVDVYF